jgi:hypothetical protein
VSSSGHVYGHVGFDEDMQFSSHYDKELTGMTWDEIKTWCEQKVIDLLAKYSEFIEQVGGIEVLSDATDYVYLDQFGLGTIAPNWDRNASRKRRRANRRKTAEITWGEAQEVLDGCVDMAVSNFEELVPDYDYVEDAVSDAIHDAYESTLMYSTDQLAMIWACGALDQALQNAWEAIDEVVYDEFYKRVDPDDYRKEGRRRARRRKMRR